MLTTALESLSLGGQDPSWWQAAIRGLLLYVVALVLVRIGEKRALGKNTALDVVVAVMLGSVISRGINSATMASAVFGGAVLVLLHWVLSVIAFHSDSLGTLFKGRPRVLVRDGEIDWDAMRRSHISRQDLVEALRAESRIEDVEEVRVARLERSGQVSALPRSKPPRIVDVEVADGVQRVRIELA